MAAHRHLILGGQKSGKSRYAKQVAQDWLQQAPGRQARLLVTAFAHDGAMQQRIARHQADRSARSSPLAVTEAPWDLAAALRTHSSATQLLLVDCLTLWLTNWLMPAPEAFQQKQAPAHDWPAQQALFLEALESAPGPVVLVGNEITQGVIPLGAQVRDFVDTLGLLHQRIAQGCTQVTWMVAGLPMVVKGQG